MNYTEIIEKMTLEEKAALLSGRDFWSTTAYEKYGIPSAFLADGPHGVRKQAAASDHSVSYTHLTLPTNSLV